MCPHCRQNAPIVYRGAMSYCTACGKPRIPLTGTGVNTAGQPAKVGGSVASVLGWITMGIGVVVALIVGALFQAIFPAGVIGWVLGVVIALFTGMLGLALVYGGKSLRKSGTEKERFTQEQAVFALAQNRGGMLSAMDVSQALNMPLVAADTLMTTFAKEDPDRVRLEVDENGSIYYLFPQIAALPQGPRVAPGPGVRVASEPPQAQVEEAWDDEEKRGRKASP